MELGPGGVSLCLEEAGVGFMFAPTYHPAMKVWQYKTLQGACLWSSVVFTTACLPTIQTFCSPHPALHCIADSCSRAEITAGSHRLQPTGAHAEPS